MAIQKQEGYSLPNNLVSDWADDEIYAFTAPKKRALVISVPRNLRQRKIYLYLYSSVVFQAGGEAIVETEIRCMDNRTLVGRFPHSIGDGGLVTPVNMTRSLVSIASGSGNTGNAVDMIAVSLFGWAAFPNMPGFVLLCPQNFNGEFDSIEVDINRIFNAGTCRMWIGCMSTNPNQ